MYKLFFISMCFWDFYSLFVRESLTVYPNLQPSAEGLYIPYTMDCGLQRSTHKLFKSNLYSLMVRFSLGRDRGEWAVRTSLRRKCPNTGTFYIVLYFKKWHEIVSSWHNFTQQKFVLGLITRLILINIAPLMELFCSCPLSCNWSLTVKRC